MTSLSTNPDPPSSIGPEEHPSFLSPARLASRSGSAPQRVILSGVGSRTVAYTAGGYWWLVPPPASLPRGREYHLADDCSARRVAFIPEALNRRQKMTNVLVALVAGWRLKRPEEPTPKQLQILDPCLRSSERS